MPDILKNEHGEMDYTKLFMGFAMAAVLIMQQYQTMHIAELKTQGEITNINFMNKDEIRKIQDDIHKRIAYVEQHTIPKDLVIRMLEAIDGRMTTLERAAKIDHDPREEDEFRKELK